jgi:flagellar basal-body rod protein FlgB
MANAIDKLLHTHGTALGVRAARAQVLASNIANADTPGFQARDLDFRRTLAVAISSGGSGPSSAGASMGLVRTATRHLQAEASGWTAASPALVYRSVSQASIDNNTVDLNIERAQFADNAMRYEASLTFVNGKIKSLLSALQS